MWEKEISARMNLIFAVIVVSDGNTGIWNVEWVGAGRCGVWGLDERGSGVEWA